MKSYVIAECGVNHNGDLELAKRMAEQAMIIGASAVKYQTFWNLGCLKEYELTKEQWIDLKNYCTSIDIDFLSTPHWGSPLCGYKDEDYDVIDFVDSLVNIHKVASPYLTNKKYLQYIAGKGKPLLISTGSIIHKSGKATIKEVKEALSWIPETKVTLLYCVSKYPLKEKLDINRIRELRLLGKVGLSDHSLEKIVRPFPIIEKHFKLDNNCIDANVSLNPKEFQEMINNIKNYESIFSFI